MITLSEALRKLLKKSPESTEVVIGHVRIPQTLIDATAEWLETSGNGARIVQGASSKGIWTAVLLVMGKDMSQACNNLRAQMTVIHRLSPEGWRE